MMEKVQTLLEKQFKKKPTIIIIYVCMLRHMLSVSLLCSDGNVILWVTIFGYWG